MEGAGEGQKWTSGVWINPPESPPVDHGQRIRHLARIAAAMMALDVMYLQHDTPELVFQVLMNP